MRILLRAGLVAIVAILMAPWASVACDCGYAGPPCKAFPETPYVFAGRVAKISEIAVKMKDGESYKAQLVLLQIERNFRGQDGKATAEVVTGFGGGDCGYSFREGAWYLVYAYPHPATGKLYTGICQRTRLLSEASEDLEYLAKKDDPEHGAGIEGWIDEESRDEQNITEVIGVMAGVRVEIEGNGGHWTTVTGKDGAFRVWGLKPGSYRVTPQWGRKFVAEGETVKLAANSCASVRFLAMPPRREK